MRTRSSSFPPPPAAGWAYFLDIDGTLLDLAPAPDRVIVDRALAPLIERLHRWTGGAVALLTGRSIADVDRFFPVPDITIAGQHGLELRGIDTDAGISSIDTNQLLPIRQHLVQAAAANPALSVEFKGACIALHYRTNPRLGGYANRLMRSLQARHAPDFTVLRGKRIVELKPTGYDKGSAIRAIMTSPPFAGRLPVFLGDDVTDEFGFAVVNELRGHAIKIGPGKTAARWRLKDVSAVRAWLQSGFDTTNVHNE